MEINKYLLLDCFLLFLFIIIGMLLYYDLTSHTDEKTECVLNPLKYGAQELTKSNRANFSCNCIIDKPNPPLIYFDSYGMNIEYPNQPARTNVNYDEILRDFKPSPNQ